MSTVILVRARNGQNLSWELHTMCALFNRVAGTGSSRKSLPLDVQFYPSEHDRCRVLDGTTRTLCIGVGMSQRESVGGSHSRDNGGDKQLEGSGEELHGEVIRSVDELGSSRRDQVVANERAVCE